MLTLPPKVPAFEFSKAPQENPVGATEKRGGGVELFTPGVENFTPSYSIWVFGVGLSDVGTFLTKRTENRKHQHD